MRIRRVTYDLGNVIERQEGFFLRRDQQSNRIPVQTLRNDPDKERR